MNNIKPSDITWETIDGQSDGYATVDGTDYDIHISERVVQSMWTTGTNTRSWSLARTDDNRRIADGEAEGLRASKRDALAALDAYLEHPGFDGQE